MSKVLSEDLVSKLSLQVDSFQDGFKILAKSSSIEELGLNFNHILRGSLLITDVNLFHKRNKELEWITIFSKDNRYSKLLDDLTISSSYSISFPDEKPYKVICTIPLIDKSFFGIILGNKLDGAEYSDIEKIFLQIFLQILDNAYQAYINYKKEKQLIFALKHRVVQLNNLIGTGIEISNLHKIGYQLELALERAVSLTNSSKGALKTIKNGKVVSTIVLPMNYDLDEIFSAKYKIEAEVEFQGLTYSFCLANKETRKGIEDFDDTDYILLSAIAMQVTGALENEHLHKEALLKEKIKKELSVASTIQQKIIPAKLPEIPGYDISGINIPSAEVGGDYYDCMKLNDGRFALIIADVAGKGVPSALLVSTLNASLFSYLDLQIPLSEMAVKINSIIFNASPPDKFITFFIAVLNPENGELDIINAGHNPILLLKKDKSLKKIDAGGVAFGMFDMGLPFLGEQMVLEKGERLMLYTDGIPEAMNEKEEEYSDKKMEDFFCENYPDNASDFINDIVADVRKHTAGTPQSDDITALYLIRK
ncbi:MAG TPA: PP2C family protein-serine/threonine phosphatase [Ignavibacteriaceae bacterium]|nr:PP2C family protein-serine/threonine phosphatase [Ignavibacteriaceae bacterium]